MRLIVQKLTRNKGNVNKYSGASHGYSSSFTSWYTNNNKVNINDSRYSMSCGSMIDYVLRDDNSHDLLSFNGVCGYHYFIRNIKYGGIESYYLTRMNYSL